MKVYWTGNAEEHLDTIRELIEFPYRIIYRIKPDRIDVLAVVHGATLLETDVDL